MLNEESSPVSQEPSPAGGLRKIVLRCLAAVVIYVLSSGPMIGLGCWLRETTGNDVYYCVFWLYYPLFLLPRNPLLETYFEFWVVQVFQTVGPG